MTAEQFRPETKHESIDAADLEGYYGSRVSVTEGTQPQSNSRLVQAKPGGLDNPTSGNFHRSTMKAYEHPKLDHKPYTTAHRPAHSPSEPFDPQGLKAHQERMLSDKQKAKHRKAK